MMAMYKIPMSELTIGNFIQEVRTFLQSHIDNDVADSFTLVLYDVLKMYADVGYHWVGYYNGEYITEATLIFESNMQYFARFVIIPYVNKIINFDWDKLGTLNTDKPNTVADVYENNNDTMGENSPLNAVLGEIVSPNNKIKGKTSGNNTRTFSGDLVNLEWIKTAINQAPVIVDIVKQFRKLIAEFMEVL